MVDGWIGHKTALSPPNLAAIKRQVGSAPSGAAALDPARIRGGDMTGTEWIVEAYGCPADVLRDLSRLHGLFARLIEDLDLHPCGEPQWHRFPESGGVTGLAMLSESHLACHTFPEFGTLCLNVFCCRPRPDWPFARQLREVVGADSVNVRRVERPYTAIAGDADALAS